MKALILRILILGLVLHSLMFLGTSVVRAEEMTCPTPTSVTVDIKPGEVPNKINLSAKGMLAVAVLTSAGFDASQFTPEMAHLTDAALPMSCAGATAVRSKLEDVNKDGRPDLVFFFQTQDLNLTAGSTAAMLMAHGSYGSVATHIMGTDSVQVKP